MKKDVLIHKFKHLLNRIIIDFYEFKTKVGRKQKFDNFFYIKYIFRIFFFGDLWETFQCPKCIDRSSIRKKFYLWRDLGIFKIAYDVLFESFCDDNKFKQLFIDASCVQNMNCSNPNVAYYYKIKSKKQLKLSILSTKNNIPISYVLTNPKPNDNQHITNLIDNIKKNKNIKLYKNVKIIGDKGYLTKKKQYFVNKVRINIIVPKKKNQKSRHNKNTNKLFNKRFTVEQTFSHIKRSYRRLQMIYDRDLKNYETFLIMAFTCQLIRKQ